jgi:hypothetical protein
MVRPVATAPARSNRKSTVTGRSPVRNGDKMPRITDAHQHPSGLGADADAASRRLTSRPSRLQPTAQVDHEPQNSPTRDDVARLAEALRAAKRAHSVSLAELRQADADPVEDWAVWYAEYLLGVR